MMSKSFAVIFACASLVACHDKRAPNAENFAPALVAYLAERGELCVGKSEWPIDVSEREAELGTRDAKQLPVLEQLGLVRSADATATRKNEDETYEVRVKRYDLTPAGRSYYHARKSKDAQGNLVAQADLCAAKLSLDQVKSWQLTTSSAGRQSAVLYYTYHIAPAPWATAPAAQRVFPAVARVLQGAGKDELREELVLTADGWVASELLGTPSAPAPTASQASAP
jgi:hypothetical protein